MTPNLGVFAANDLPLPNQRGIYKVPTRGWFAQAYTVSYGPFATQQDAAACLDLLGAKPGLCGSWPELAWWLVKMLGAAIGLFGAFFSLAWVVMAITKG